MKNPAHEVLGIPENATWNEIICAYGAVIANLSVLQNALKKQEELVQTAYQTMLDQVRDQK